MTSKINSKGVKYFLHSVAGIGRGKKGILYFFSKKPEGEIEKPANMEILENPRTYLPYLKKIAPVENTTLKV